MKKRIICAALALAMVLSLCGCGSDGKYKVVKSLGSQEYSIGFRNGDSNYHYIDRALRALSYEGKIDEISRKWFGTELTYTLLRWCTCSTAYRARCRPRRSRYWQEHPVQAAS